MKQITIVHCPTLEDWDAVTKKANLTWTSGRWSTYLDASAIYIELNEYCYVNYYTGKGHTVISAAEYLGKDGKIIGYKCPVTIFDGTVAVGTIYKASGMIRNTYYPAIFPEHTKFNLPKELVETWEPVYETQREVLTLGSNGVEVIIDNGVVTSRSAKFDLDKILDIRDTLSNSTTIGGYTAFINKDVRCFQIGCDQEKNLFSLNELQQVLTIANKQLGRS